MFPGSCETRLKEQQALLQQRESSLKSELRKREDALMAREARAANKEKMLESEKIKVYQREGMISAREREVKAREEAVKARELEVQRHGLDVQRWHEQRQNEQRQRSLNTAGFSAAYHVHRGSMKGERFSQLVEPSVRELSGLPKERFVMADEGQRYPLVLLFVATGGTQVVEIVQKAEISRCRSLLTPGGELILVTLRAGVNLQPGMGGNHPNGVDNMIELSYFADIAGDRPHELNSPDTSQMNRIGAGKLKQLVNRLVPPPPKTFPQRLFHWLPTFGGHDTYKGEL